MRRLIVGPSNGLLIMAMAIVGSPASAFGPCVPAGKRSTSTEFVYRTGIGRPTTRATPDGANGGRRRRGGTVSCHGQRGPNASCQNPVCDESDESDRQRNMNMNEDLYDTNLPNKLPNDLSNQTNVKLAEQGMGTLGWQSYFAEQLDEEESPTCNPVRVTEVRSNGIRVVGKDMDQRMIPPSSLGKQHRVVVGDWILIDAQQHKITRVLDRTSLLQRRAPGSGGKTQLLVANLDTVFLVSSCNQDFNVARLERYVAMALEANVTPVIVLTKRDVLDDGSEEASAVLNSYLDDAREIAGVAVVVLDARGDEPTDKLAEWCRPGHTVAFLGSSGVGKSTLANSLCGQRVAETGTIHEDSGQGRHTTTRRQLYFLSNGCAVVDTPGLRELQLFDVSQGLTEVFSDLVELSLQCRFNDCQHAGEPGCAIEEAVENGELDGYRVTRWQKLVSEDEVNSKTVAEGKVKALQKTMRQKKSKKTKRYQE
jgi:ribosome biogenesis GTPase / thiamine phosphate phosphatase